MEKYENGLRASKMQFIAYNVHFAERLGGKKVSDCDCVREDGDASERYGDDGARISGGGRRAPISP